MSLNEEIIELMNDQQVAKDAIALLKKALDYSLIRNDERQALSWDFRKECQDLIHRFDKSKSSTKGELPKHKFDKLFIVSNEKDLCKEPLDEIFYTHDQGWTATSLDEAKEIVRNLEADDELILSKIKYVIFEVTLNRVE